MLSKKIYKFSMSIVICTLLLTTGCTNTIALKFVPEDTTTYKVKMEYIKSIEWMGPASSKPTALQGGRTGNSLEITFTQEILSVNSEGNAVARITFKDLKYFKEIRNELALDFDSSRAADADNPLNGLIRQSYFIEISKDGQVLRIIDTSDAQQAISGSSPAHLTALNLLSENFIKERHTIPALPDTDENQTSIGEKWSNIKNFSFDMMGGKSYERVYTLEKIQEPIFAGLFRLFNKDLKNDKVAVARMEAFPSSQEAKELYKEQGTSQVSSLFDNIQTYTGELKFDLTAGKVERYYEKLLTEWVIADPSPEGSEQPDALKMGATRSYSIERIE